MKVYFKIKSKKDQIWTITNFLSNDDCLNGRFEQSILKQFKISANALKNLSFKERLKIVFEKVSPIYDKKLLKMKGLIKIFQKAWDENELFINTEFMKIFGINTENKICNAEINLNHICPRYLNTWSFDVFCDATTEHVLQTCIHELTHFLWFEKWKQVFLNWKCEQFEAPQIPWLLSEISIDPILKFSEFKNLISDKPAYDYFYTTTVKGKNLIEIFRKLYVKNSLENYMKKGLKFLMKQKKLVEDLIK